MQISIRWNEYTYSTDVSETEGDLWKEVASNLPTIPVPNKLLVDTPYGNAEFSITKRGTFVKDGVKKPSMYVVEDFNNICGLSKSSYEDAYLTCINPESNNYKFYWLKPKNYGIDATYGRIGSSRGDAFGVKDLQEPYDTYMYWIRYYEKLSKGYTDQTDIFLHSDKITKPSKSAAKKIASKDAVSNELYVKLKRFAKQVVESNLKDSNVTKAQVKEARKILNRMGQVKTVKCFNKHLMNLMTISPRKMRDVTNFLAEAPGDFAHIIEREDTLITAMEALADDDIVITDDFSSYGMEVYIATDKQKEQVLNKLSPQLQSKVSQVYRVIHKGHKKRFDQYLKKHQIKNVKQLWHGSKNENWFSIAVNGLQLNPNAAITGKMFGYGIYFAPSSMKSWNYTSFNGTYWAHGTSNTGFMGLYATAYGTPEDVYTSGNFTQSYLNHVGKNCVHAHAGTQLRNDEIIFYDEDAILLQYIVEFK